MKNTKIQYNSSINLLKLLAFLFLVITHWEYSRMGKIIGYNATSVNPEFYDVISYMCKVSVAIFSVISGLFIYKNKISTFRYAQNMLFFIIASFIYNIILSSILSASISKVSGAPSIGDIFLEFATTNWYLWAIFIVYLIQPLIIKILNYKHGEIIMIIFSVVGIAISPFIAKFSGIIPPAQFTTWIGVLSLSFFGYMIANKYYFGKYIRLLIVFPIIILFLLFFHIIPENERIIKNNFSLYSTLMGISLTSIFYNMNFKSKLIDSIARKAHFFYPIHYIFRMAFILITKNMNLSMGSLLMYQLIFVYVLTIFFSWGNFILDKQLKILYNFIKNKKLSKIT